MTEQQYYGRGKLLLTGEYFILGGAKSLALPTVLGQKMFVKSKPSNAPRLYWKSYDPDNSVWFETVLELWRFDCIENETINENPSEEIQTLQKILRQARSQNIHFLRDEDDVHVETELEFPISWGLGSSSTLIYNIAQWAYISPFELLKNTFGGSGYDISCAQSLGPISYEIQCRGPHWETVNYNPVFKDQLYFLYLDKKQNSREGIRRFNDLKNENFTDYGKRISEITDEIINAVDLAEFESLIFEHESIVSHALDLPRIKDLEFSDYWGAVKSLGAWGGDFALVTSNKSIDETKMYFAKRGHSTLIKFDDLILQNFGKLATTDEDTKLEGINSNA